MTVPTAWLEDILSEPPAAPPPPPGPKLLTAQEAAPLLGLSAQTLYRHSKRYPFTRKLSHRVLRFDAAELEAWIRAH